MTLGVHRLIQNEMRSCYFIKRKFGNYVFFTDALSNVDYDFLKSKGGVYKQFVENPQIVSLKQCQLFKSFGSPAVYLNKTEENLKTEEQIPFESYGDNFIDPSLIFDTTPWGGHWVVLRQNSENIIVLGKDFFLTSDYEIYHHKNLISLSSFRSHMLKMNISWLFFCSHDPTTPYFHYETLEN